MKRRLAWFVWSVLCLGPATLFAEPSVVDTAVAHYHSGLAYARLGRLNDAYTEFQLACVLDNDDARRALALGITAVRLNRLEPAQRSLERSVLLDSHSVASYYLLALLYEKQQAVKKATDSWRRFLELNVDTLLRDEGRDHLRALEATAAPDPADVGKARKLTVVLGQAKVLDADNRVVERSNPILVPVSVLPLKLAENLPRITADTAPLLKN